MRQTFRKQERLTGKKTFEALVKHGEEFYQFPFRVKWMHTDAEMPFPAQVAFAVPKRLFKRATQRNRVKRLLRESYRRHKQPFYESLGKQGKKVRAMLIYTHREVPQLKETDAKIIVTLERLIKASDGLKSGAGKAK